MYTLVIKEQKLPTVTMTLYRFAKIGEVVEDENHKCVSKSEAMVAIFVDT